MWFDISPTRFECSFFFIRLIDGRKFGFNTVECEFFSETKFALRDFDKIEPNREMSVDWIDPEAKVEEKVQSSPLVSSVV